jgi:hypothetical protein
VRSSSHDKLLLFAGPRKGHQEGAVFLGYNVMRHPLIQDKDAADGEFYDLTLDTKSDLTAQSVDDMLPGTSCSLIRAPLRITVNTMRKSGCTARVLAARPAVWSAGWDLSSAISKFKSTVSMGVCARRSSFSLAIKSYLVGDSAQGSQGQTLRIRHQNFVRSTTTQGVRRDCTKDSAHFFFGFEGNSMLANTWGAQSR